ncbi:ribosomal protein S18-alanine N-acetyltransferase [bacterium]|nr:ribosomal protein S18-alanine N-acetyltransferase [bacterium]
MEAADIDAIFEIEKSAYGEHHWSKESFFNELQNNIGYYLVAYEPTTKTIVGYLGSWMIVDECHITNVAVDLRLRRQKIAEQLIVALINHCYEQFIKYITLEVRVSNIPAIALYEKFGFKSIGVRKKYYQDNNEDALIMFTENIWHEKFKTVYNNLVGRI